MKKLFEYTENFDKYVAEQPYNEVAYRVLITHDNSQNSIENKFLFSFLDAQNNPDKSILINNWKIFRIYPEYYYGRAIVCVKVADPIGSILPTLKSGGFTLDISEGYNIREIENSMLFLLKKVRKISCFMNLRARLDYIEILSKDGVPTHKL